jgi:hypothetical protein
MTCIEIIERGPWWRTSNQRTQHFVPELSIKFGFINFLGCIAELNNQMNKDFWIIKRCQSCGATQFHEFDEYAHSFWQSFRKDQIFSMCRAWKMRNRLLALKSKDKEWDGMTQQVWSNTLSISTTSANSTTRIELLQKWPSQWSWQPGITSSHCSHSQDMISCSQD